MKVLSDITSVSSSGVTSEASGYELVNAINYEKPRDVWRSTDLLQQTITLNFTGNINTLALFGANFTEITIAGNPFNLALDRLTRTYKGFFTFPAETSTVSVVVASQSVSEAYFTLSGIVIGNYDEVCNVIFPANRSFITPVNAVKMEGGYLSEEPRDNGYNFIELLRNKQERNSLEEFNNLKRIVAKTEVFVLYEDMGAVNRCYLCRRTDSGQYVATQNNRYTDSLNVRELAA